MTGSRFSRGPRSRLFVFVGLALAFGAVLYFFRDIQLKLQEARREAEKFQQQQESLSAQLQVVFEYKSRLETSLQQEKAEHRQTREELEARIEEQKQLHEKESLEAINKFSSLQQHNKMLQSQHEDLQSECEKLSQAQIHNAQEKATLESKNQQLQQQLLHEQDDRRKELEGLKTDVIQMHSENERLQKERNNFELQSEQANSVVLSLKKEQFQLRRENKAMQTQLDTCKRKMPPRTVVEHAEQVKAEDVVVAAPLTNNNQGPKPSSSTAANASSKSGDANRQNVLIQPSDVQNGAQSQQSSSPASSPPSEPGSKEGKSLGAPQQKNSPGQMQKPEKELPEKVFHVQANIDEPPQKDNDNYWNQQQPQVVAPVIPKGVVPAPEGYRYDGNDIRYNSNNLYGQQDHYARKPVRPIISPMHKSGYKAAELQNVIPLYNNQLYGNQGQINAPFLLGQHAAQQAHPLSGVQEGHQIDQPELRQNYPHHRPVVVIGDGVHQGQHQQFGGNAVLQEPNGRDRLERREVNRHVWRAHPQYQYNGGDYDKEEYPEKKEAAPREEGEIPRIPPEDLQLEEEAEEGDDDIVDDGDDDVKMGNKNRNHIEQGIQNNRPRQADKKDSVMVNQI